MSPSLFAVVFAQAATAAAPAAGADPAATPPAGSALSPFFYLLVLGAMIYFALIRPQSQAKKKQEETIKSAKTGDRVVTSSGIHGVITNVKDSTVIVRVADNVKLEIEKSHLDKIIRDAAAAGSDKPATAKVS